MSDSEPRQPSNETPDRTGSEELRPADAAGEREAASASPAPDAPAVGSSRWAVTVSLVLLSVAALYLARAVVLPLVVALLAAALLSPLVRRLEALKVPPPLGAAIVLFGLLGLGGWAGWALKEPAIEWLDKAPRSLHRIEHKVRKMQEPVEKVNQAAEQMEKITDVAKGSSGAREVAVSRRDPLTVLLSGTGRLFGAALVTLILVFFLLATGRTFLAGALGALPDGRSRSTALSVLRRIGSDVSVYLLTITVINTSLALVVGGALSLTAMPNPFLWGALAGLLNFVPYLGAMTTATILAAVALLTFDEPWHALGVVALFASITALEGMVITPTILGHRMRLHPIVVFVSLMFWGWLWGVPGALLAVPLTASLKIVGDEVESLSPFARVLGR